MDKPHWDEVQADLDALAETGMSKEALARVLKGAEKQPLAWEVGEAFAECMLSQKHGAEWPWNMQRDKRTPRASLPGADIIGFLKREGRTILLLGEVKSSSQGTAPPSVLIGRGGMIHQLDTLANDIRIHCSLITWLHPRCKHSECWTMFQEAIRAYLKSNGRDIALFGILIRDTQPNEMDLRNRAVALGKVVVSPTSVELNAWYLPCRIDDLVRFLDGDLN